MVFFFFLKSTFTSKVCEFQKGYLSLPNLNYCDQVTRSPRICTHGWDLVEDNLERTLFSRIVNKFVWMEDHISFTSEFALLWGTYLENFGEILPLLLFFKVVGAIPKEDLTTRFFFGDGAVNSRL